MNWLTAEPNLSDDEYACIAGATSTSPLSFSVHLGGASRFRLSCPSVPGQDALSAEVSAHEVPHLDHRFVESMPYSESPRRPVTKLFHSGNSDLGDDGTLRIFFFMRQRTSATYLVAFRRAKKRSTASITFISQEETLSRQKNVCGEAAIAHRRGFQSDSDEALFPPSCAMTSRAIDFRLAGSICSPQSRPPMRE